MHGISPLARNGPHRGCLADRLFRKGRRGPPGGAGRSRQMCALNDAQRGHIRIYGRREAPPSTGPSRPPAWSISTTIRRPVCVGARSQGRFVTAARDSRSAGERRVTPWAAVDSPDFAGSDQRLSQGARHRPDQPQAWADLEQDLARATTVSRQREAAAGRDRRGQPPRRTATRRCRNSLSLQVPAETIKEIQAGARGWHASKA